MPIRGETVGHAYVKVHADGTGLDREVEDEFDDAGKKAGAAFGESYNDEWNKKFQSSLDQMDKDFANQNRGFRSQLTKTGKKIDEAFGELGDALPEYRENIRTLTNDINRLVESYEVRVIPTFRQVRVETRRAKTDFEALRKQIHELDNESDHLSLTLGKSFGKGSRNDFVNIIGSLVGGVARATNGITKFLGGISESGVKLGEFISKVGGADSVFGKFGSTLARFASRGGGAGGGGAAAAGAIGIPFIIVAIYNSIGILASAITGIMGILIAFISTLAFGLVGALGAVATALIPLIAGFAVLALAIANLDKKTLKALKPVAKAFEDLGKAAADTFSPYLIKNVDQFVGIIRGLEPLVVDSADALGKVMDEFLKDLKDPALDDLQKRFERWIPNAIESLGGSLGNFGIGLAGVFQSAIPLANDFLGWLAGITEEFNEWANSAKGQKALMDFFDKAGESAAILGDFLGAITESIYELIDAGRGTGNSFFESLTGQLDKFTEWAQSKEGKRALEDFFTFVQDLGEEIGELVLDVVELMDAFDSPTARKNLLLLIDLIQMTVGLMTRLVTKIEQFRNLMEGISGTITEPFSKLSGTIRTLVGQAFNGLGGFIKKQIGKVDLFGIFGFPSFAKIAGKFGGLAGAIIRAIGPGAANLMEVFGFPSLGKIAGKFAGLASAIVNAAGDFSLSDWLDIFNIPSMADIANAFSGLDEAIENAVGTVTIDIAGNLVGKLASKGWGLLPGGASGGLFDGARAMVIGEDGPEALVPLNRPLHQVDPAVRELSAIAQGLTTAGRPAGIDVGGITVITPTENPAAVAQEVMNRLVAVGY